MCAREENMHAFVKAESVDKGKELGAPDAFIIEKAIKENWIKVVKLNRKQSLRVRRLIRETRIGLGEAGALTLARDKGMMVILDDREARAIARALNVMEVNSIFQTSQKMPFHPSTH